MIKRGSLSPQRRQHILLDTANIRVLKQFLEALYIHFHGDLRNRLKLFDLANGKG
jgi:hypothetical protein